MRIAIYLLAALLVLCGAGYLVVLTGDGGGDIPATPEEAAVPAADEPRAAPPSAAEAIPPAPEPVPPVADDSPASAAPVEARSAEGDGAEDDGAEDEGGLRVFGTVRDHRTRGPVVDAVVVLQAAPGAPRQRVTTGPDGRFEFEGVLSAHRSLLATAKGYNSKFHRLRADRAGRADLSVDLALRPKTRVTGRVVGPDGAPLAGAGVNLYRIHQLLGAARPQRPQALTDEKGRFEVWVAGGSAKRKMRLFAAKDGYAPGYSPEFVAAPGERVDNLVIAVDRAGRVEGRILREDRRPFKGVDVSLWPMIDQKLVAPTAGVAITHVRGRTDAEGRFRIEDVPVGTYRMTAWFKTLRLIRDGIVVTRQQTTGGLEFEMPTGRGIVGVVLDRKEKPIKGARIRVEPAATPPPVAGPPRGRVTRPEGRQWAITDAEGHYQVFRLENVIHRVVVARKGFESVTIPGVAPGAAPLRTVLSRIFAVRGVVVLPDGETPCPEFQLRVFVTYDKRMRPGRTQRVKEKSGAFSLKPELFAGAAPHYIRVSTVDGHLSDLVPVRLASGQEPEPLRIVLRRGASISGVVRAEDGQPVTMANVLIRTDANRFQRSVRTTAHGRFEANALPPGDYTITATHGDWVGAGERVTIAGARDHRVSLTLLRHGATLRMTVVDVTGAPVPRAHLTLRTGLGRYAGIDLHKYRRLYHEAKKTRPGLSWSAYYAAATRTDETGRLERRFLPGGRYRVNARASGYHSGTTEVVLAPGGGGAVKFVLEKRPPRPAERPGQKGKRLNPSAPNAPPRVPPRGRF